MARHVRCVDVKNSCLSHRYFIATVSVVPRNVFDEIAIIMWGETINIIGAINVFKNLRTINYSNLQMFRFGRSNSRRKRTTKHTKKVGSNAIVASDGSIRFVLFSTLVRTKTSGQNLLVPGVQLRNARRQEGWKQLPPLQWLKIFNVQNSLNTLKPMFASRWLNI